MRIYKKIICLQIMVSCLFLFAVFGYSFSDNEEPKPVKPDYEDVDVFFECDWGANENMVQAKVFDKTNTEHPYLLIYQNNGVHVEVLLVKGIIVRIFDHESGKLLKTYIGAEYKN